MTNQELFNRVVAHLRAQGCAAKEWVTHPNSRAYLCRYRTADGKKCAVGCLIPDERYIPDLEGKIATHAVVATAAGLEGHNLQLATRLQAIHDWIDPREWPEQLKQLAAEFELEVPVG